LATLLAKYAITALLLSYPAIAAGADLSRATDLAGYSRFWLGMSAQALTVYLAHSSVASLQIGLMKMLGYTAPERYRFPLMARDPLDFWRRWNTYVGGWMRLYVFQPLTVHLRRRVGIRSKNAIRALAVMATFATGGAVHEYMLFSRSFTCSGAVIAVFVFHGVLILLWVPLESLARKVSTATGVAPRGWLLSAAHVASNQCFMQLALVSAWLIFAGLSGTGLPASLQRMIASGP